MKNFISLFIMVFGTVLTLNAKDYEDQAMETYNKNIQSGSSQNQATAQYLNAYWDCINNGGTSEHTIVLKG